MDKLEETFYDFIATERERIDDFGELTLDDLNELPRYRDGCIHYTYFHNNEQYKFTYAFFKKEWSCINLTQQRIDREREQNKKTEDMILKMVDDLESKYHVSLLDLDLIEKNNFMYTYRNKNKTKLYTWVLSKKTWQACDN
jgi:hypothetical protein